MKILLLGSNGQLGQELHRVLPLLGALKACGRNEVDLTDSGSIAAAIDVFQPDVIVNAAAYTAVDKAESERELAFKVNATAVAVLAEEAAKRNIWLIHYSTDYVFDGSSKHPYSETDQPRPINVYGESKLAGEKAIASSGCKHVIFRTTWVIGPDGHNFAKTILRLAIERESLNVIDDQFGVPTTPTLIAKITAAAIDATASSTPWPSGLYHLAPHGKTSWFGIAQTLIQQAREQRLSLLVNESSLQPIETSEYPTPAKRPKNSLLNTNKLEQQLSFNLPEWKDHFLEVVDQIIKEIKSA